MDYLANALVYEGMVDTHTHLSAMADNGIDIAGIFGFLKERNAGLVVDVSIDPFTLPLRRRLGADYPNIVYTSGIHPSLTGRPDLESMTREVSRQLDGNRDAEQPFIVAVGETGLDWYRLYAPKHVQIRSFERHLEFAAQTGLPVIIHNREADEDIYRLLKKHTPPAGGVMHCFSSDATWMERFADLGMYISFAGNVTFPSAEPLRAALRATPEDRLLLETDAPYLTPVPVRGRPNHPAYIGHLYRYVANLLSRPVSEIVSVVAKNANRLFAQG